MRTVDDIDALVANLRAMADDLSLAGDAADMIESMWSWLHGDCECPCCLGVTHCEDGCTFAGDAPSDAEWMAKIRQVVFG
jgi:hypothetical protein